MIAKSFFSSALKSVLMLTLTSVFTFVSCESDPAPGQDDGDNDDGEEVVTPEEVYPLVVTDGKARFYVRELPNSLRGLYGKPVTNWADYTVKVNGVQYPVLKDEQGRDYVDVIESSTYNAVLLSSKSSNYHGSNEYEDVLHPFSYAYHNAKDVINALPHYAQYSESTGGMLFFSSAVSLLEITVTGSASVASVKVENPDGGLLAGLGSYDTAKKEYTAEQGVPFVVLNCTNKGNFVPLSDAGVKFLVPVASGTYSSGLDITICDSDHKMVKTHIPAFTVKSDDVHKCTVEYRPASDLLFYEGFDNFVWGGDIVGGSGTFGMIPKNESVTTSSFRSLTGYETPLYQAAYDTPGAGYIQPDEGVANLKGFTVAEKSYLSTSYVKSRNIGKYPLLYHCQEYQGYVSVGAGGVNGTFEAPFVGEIIKSYKDVKVSFDYCPMPDFDDDIMLTTVNGANILSCRIDGQDAVQTQFSRSYQKTSSTAYLLNKAVQVSASASQRKQWHHVELVVNNMNEISALQITTGNTECKNRSFYLDNFEVRSLDDHVKTSFTKTLRVMFWNIQYGMWADQKYNYDNFVACVSKYKPDVCVWCEAESYYDNNEYNTYMNEKGPNTGVGSLKGGDLTGWKALASRYGHENVNVSDNTNSNFPQVITSRYPITRVAAISGTGGHPAGLFKINCGEDVYILSLHLTPGLKDAANDTKRLNEIQYLCQYITPYQDGNFLMMGDFNTVSPHDKWFYDSHKYPNMTSNPYQALEYLNANTKLKDVIHESYPDSFLSSVREETQRIDYMYASPSMMSRLKTADLIIDKWVKLELYPTTKLSYMCTPSDHRPIIADYSFE